MSQSQDNRFNKKDKPGMGGQTPHTPGAGTGLGKDKDHRQGGLPGGKGWGGGAGTQIPRDKDERNK